MGEAAECERAFEQAAAAYGRALTVFADVPSLAERAIVPHNRAQCLIRAAELRGDLKGLAKAEQALRADLAESRPVKDPLAWGVRQLCFARLYDARAHIAGRDAGEEAAAAEGLAAALEVFGEHGRRDLADTAARELERLRARAVRAGRHNG
jgi:hypothetical protein